MRSFRLRIWSWQHFLGNSQAPLGLRFNGGQAFPAGVPVWPEFVDFIVPENNNRVGLGHLLVNADVGIGKRLQLTAEIARSFFGYLSHYRPIVISVACICIAIPNHKEYHVGMKRTHIFLPQPVIDRLKALSEKTGLSVAELIRRAIDEYLGRKK